MQVRVEEQGGWKRRMTVEIDVEEVEREMDRVVESYRRRAALPGFRKGKAPTDVIRGRFQNDLEADLLNKLIPEAYEEALQEQGLRSIGSPRFHDIRFAVGQPLQFTADFEIWPVVEVSGFRDLAFDQEILEVDEEMIDEALDQIRESRAGFDPVDRPSRQGDRVTALLEPIDVHGQRLKGSKPEEIRMEAGGANLLPEFQAASLGVTVGETKPLEVVYPEKFQDAQLAGQTRRFRMIVRKIEEKKLPARDDEFARSIDPNLDLAGMRAKLRIRMESEELIRSKQRLEEELIDRLLEANRVEVPEIMIEFSMGRIAERARQDSGDIDEEELQGRFRPAVERMHKRDILLENLARQESLEVDDEEIEAELDKMAEDAGVEIDILRRKMESEGELDRMRETLQERKVIDFLIAGARVTRVKKPRKRPEKAEGAGRIIVP